VLLHISLMSDDNGSNNLIRGVINTRLGSHCRIHYSSFALQIYHQVSEGMRGPRRPGGPRAPRQVKTALSSYSATCLQQRYWLV